MELCRSLLCSIIPIFQLLLPLSKRLPRPSSEIRANLLSLLPLEVKTFSSKSAGCPLISSFPTQPRKYGHTTKREGAPCFPFTSGSPRSLNTKLFFSMANCQESLMWWEMTARWIIVTSLQSLQVFLVLNGIDSLTASFILIELNVRYISPHCLVKAWNAGLVAWQTVLLLFYTIMHHASKIIMQLDVMDRLQTDHRARIVFLLDMVDRKCKEYTLSSSPRSLLLPFLPAAIVEYETPSIRPTHLHPSAVEVPGGSLGRWEETCASRASESI